LRVVVHNKTRKTISYDRLLPAASLDGGYATNMADEDGPIECELSLQKPSIDGLMQVLELEEFYTDAALSIPELIGAVVAGRKFIELDGTRYGIHQLSIGAPSACPIPFLYLRAGRRRKSV
jgi:hypothetical protein